MLDRDDIFTRIHPDGEIAAPVRREVWPQHKNVRVEVDATLALQRQSGSSARGRHPTWTTTGRRFTSLAGWTGSSVARDPSNPFEKCPARPREAAVHRHQQVRRAGIHA